MKKVETHRQTIDDRRSFSLFVWRLTDDEKESLRSELVKYESEVVEQFIDEIEIYCDTAMLLFKNPDRTFMRRELQRALRRFEKAMEELELISDRKLS